MIEIMIRGLMWLFSKQPLKVHYFFARIIAYFARNIIRYRYDEVLINITRAFPERPYWEIKPIVKDFYRHLANVIVETIWFGGCTNPKRLRDSGIIKIDNQEELDRLYEIAPSVIILCSHCGNWEMAGGMESFWYEGTKCSRENFVYVYKKMESEMWERIMKRNRLAPLQDKSYKEGYVESKNVVKYIFSHRSEKKFYNLNTDQRPYYKGSDELKVSFMGQKTRTMSAGAAIAHKFGMAVTFCKMYEKSIGHYGIRYITICDDASKLSVQEIMDKYYELLDSQLREQPYNYLWSHKRWNNIEL